MKREARLLLSKAIDSLLLGVEVFNRPQDRGRTATVLILLDHSFEMLLKAAILHRGGSIRDKDASQTIGFDACVRRALTDGAVKFLTEEQTLLLQAINGLRDAAQHHVVDVSEEQLYMHSQSGITLFRDVLKSVFDRELLDVFPCRVLPVSTRPIIDLDVLFDHEVAEVMKLLQPGRRRSLEAQARLRPLAILDGALRGEKGTPSDARLRHIGETLRKGNEWPTVFPGVAAVHVVSEESGPTLSLRISKKEGIPTVLVPEGTPGAAVVAVKRVNELGYYNLNSDQLAEHLGLTRAQALAAVAFFQIRKDPEFYSEFPMAKAVVFKRYSQKAIPAIKKGLTETPIEDVWAWHQAERHRVP
ncbi:MAG: hypothetical protein M0R22_03980 [Dehalococcoidia bacterium]|jgi:hypothetical protein|nr:hypothetical protein [Dehalococcoidia bacterium]